MRRMFAMVRETPAQDPACRPTYWTGRGALALVWDARDRHTGAAASQRPGMSTGNGDAAEDRGVDQSARGRPQPGQDCAATYSKIVSLALLLRGATGSAWE